MIQHSDYKLDLSEELYARFETAAGIERMATDSIGRLMTINNTAAQVNAGLLSPAEGLLLLTGSVNY